LTAWAYGAWAKIYRLGLLFDLWSFLSLGVSRPPSSGQLRLVFQYRTRFTVVFSYGVLQHLTRNAFLQETRDLGAPFLTILLFRLSLTTTSLGRSFLGSILDLGWRISGPEPPVGVPLSVLGQGSGGLGLPDFPLIVW
jgi:hypothetical protein